MRPPLIAGNWKMHGAQQSATLLLTAIAEQSAMLATQAVELAVFPPFVHLPLCAPLLAQTAIKWGAQTCSAHADGAYTGDVSAKMLASLGCHYVIVGHSERRAYHHETNADIEKTGIAVIDAGLTPILCVGETLQERQEGATDRIVRDQLAVASRLKDNCSAFTEIVIAYEPVWAIGTGQSASPEQAQAVHEKMRAQLKETSEELAAQTRILYGGSVKPSNAAELLAMPDIDGALVGGAALDAEQFLEIAKLTR